MLRLGISWLVVWFVFCQSLPSETGVSDTDLWLMLWGERWLLRFKSGHSETQTTWWELGAQKIWYSKTIVTTFSNIPLPLPLSLIHWERGGTDCKKVFVETNNLDIMRSWWGLGSTKWEAGIGQSSSHAASDPVNTSVGERTPAGEQCTLIQYFQTFSRCHDIYICYCCFLSLIW